MHTIWDNDACTMFDAISKAPDEFGLDGNPCDDEIWDEAYRQIENNLGDEIANCDITKEGEIIAIGTIERWCGSYKAYKSLKTHNIGEAFQKILAAFSGDNSFELYEDNGEVYLTQRGHDNPTNPSIFMLRELNANSLDDFLLDNDDSQEDLMKNSKALGSDVCKVYGWEINE